MKYIIYARKSTESEERQALSIQSQIHEMKELADYEKLEIVKIFEESKSAKAPYCRPVFNEMIEFIQQGKAQGILCWKIDRLSRNPVDEGTIKWLLQNSTIKRIRTIERQYNPEDNVLLASIEFSMANQYILDLSKNVLRGLKAKVEKGEYPGCVPVGYARNYRTKNIELDKKNWHYIKKAFEMYASGSWSLRTLSDQLYDEGFRSKTGVKATKTVLQLMFNNPLYCGFFRWKEKVYEGTHPPIVSQQLFEKVQKMLEPKKQDYKNQTRHKFIFRGLMTCGECGLKITAETQKGHVYYRCTKSHGTKNCSQKYVREKTLLDEFGKCLSKINFDEEILDLIVEATKEKWIMQQKNKNLLEKDLSKQLAEIKNKQNSLVTKFIDYNIPEDIYNAKQQEFRNEERTVESRLQAIKEENEDVIGKIELIVKFIKSAKDIFQYGDPKTKKEVLSILSSNIAIKDKKIALFGLSEPFNWLYQDMYALAPQKAVFEPRFLALDKTKTASHETACTDGRS